MIITSFRFFFLHQLSKCPVSSGLDSGNLSQKSLPE